MNENQKEPSPPPCDSTLTTKSRKKTPQRQPEEGMAGISVCSAPSSCTWRVETNADTSTSESRIVGASGHGSAVAASSASATTECTRVRNLPHVNASEGQSAPQEPSDSAQVEANLQVSTLKAKEDGEKRSNGTDKASNNMCAVQTDKEQNGAPEKEEKPKEPKMYEIPLTKELPSEDGGGSTRRNRKKPTNDGQTQGRWTQAEHEAFLRGLKIFGREWKKVADRVPTRTSAQIRSHAQKYFSKLARDESFMMHEASSTALATTSVAQQQQPGGGQPLSASVQRNVERILANPTAVQQEVEDTLRRLRARYRQLQIRLEQQAHAGPDGVGADGTNNDGVSAVRGAGAGLLPPNRWKRSLEDSSIASGYLNDDTSSATSDVSATLASRGFGDEELIALHVLCGTLARSASDNELRPEESRERPSSYSEGDEESETKRCRLDSSNNDRDQNQDGDQAMN